ncbi:MULTISPECIES: cation-translocating P-type ATPase [Clostridium]|uniref:P-type Ca(2+) transporter n=1 Tax=Clostridium senegalense TaxID=1465809 RepID=A0A6M0H3T6_9CLOT|nr:MULTISPECIES: cation-translocating P-type ATPase [Clostridium]NEU05416.1 cation-translocating P-type ATPase [Clostridium senegalense]
MWFNKTTEDVLTLLNSNLDNGLSSEQVEDHKSKYGLNKFTTKKPKTKVQMFFAQLNDMMIYILLVAAILSAVVGETSDSIIILIVILINAIVGMIQEAKAEKALDALKELSTPKALVKRNGVIVEIPSEDVVPGDIVIIDAGRYIPCDIRLIESANLKIEESALTGESVPVDKDSGITLENEDISLGDQKNMVFMSTLATYGRGIGVAVATGMDTEIGKIAKMLDTDESEQTPLQKKLEQLGKYLGFAAIAISIIMFVVGILQNRDILDMFITSISLAVAAIPEGLPAIVTIVLAIGVQKMIKQNAIIRKLPAVETLGSVNVICSDKTGTLTQNKMTVTKFYCNNNLNDIENLNIDDPVEKLLIENLVLCNDATSSEDSKTGDPTEIALLDIGNKYNLTKLDTNNNHPRVGEIPFDSDRKLMSTINKYSNESFVLTKGAIDNLLNLCTKIYLNNEIKDLTTELKDSILKASYKMSDDALRVLGAAYKAVEDSTALTEDDVEKNLIFIGLVGMIDPPRLEVKDSIEICKTSGIKTIMITGDHKNTAFAIAKELNIATDLSQVISGAELDKMSDEELTNSIDTLRVFARVSPEHKVKIVKAIKSKDNIVSMTGDGVNDAPSLKAADIGVAMGITGTDVAKGAADMVLTDDNFSTIVSAIKEGRNIFNNIKKSVIFLISCNAGEIVSLFLAILLGWAAPLSATHILWVNLITDTFPALALGVDPGDKDIMNKHPRNSKDSLFKGSMFTLIFNGFLIGFLTLIAFVYGAKVYGGSDITLSNIPDKILIHAQTLAFTVLSSTQLAHSLNMRNESKSIFSIGVFSNKYLISSIILGLLLQFLVITIPPIATLFGVYKLTLNDWIFVLLISLVPIIINEILKIFKRSNEKKVRD